MLGGAIEEAWFPGFSLVLGIFFFFRVLHTIFFHLRSHALARSVTMASSGNIKLL